MPPLVATPLTGILDGKFHIERPLASGAAGDVYEATHLTLGSRVAVKVLRGGTSAPGDAARRRFIHEARIAAGIQSEHVVRVFDFAAHENGLTYIVMELLQGETLGQLLRRRGPLAVSTSVDYVVQAARALSLLHENAVVHRDVKPSNLFLAHDSEGKTRVKLIDFGVAAFRRSVSDASITQSRMMIGTPRYMAPEQVRAVEHVDARVDVWALGVTLYELLAGRPPFEAKTIVAVLNKIQQESPVPLRQRRPEVSFELAAVVEGCLEKDRARRPPDARALAEALEVLHESSADPECSPVSNDALELSWNDPDIEELRPVRRVGRRHALVASGILLLGAGGSIAIAESRPPRSALGQPEARAAAAGPAGAERAIAVGSGPPNAPLAEGGEHSFPAASAPVDADGRIPLAESSGQSGGAVAASPGASAAAGSPAPRRFVRRQETRSRPGDGPPSAGPPADRSTPAERKKWWDYGF